jgi:hypothetical protein
MKTDKIELSNLINIEIGITSKNKIFYVVNTKPDNTRYTIPTSDRGGSLRTLGNIMAELFHERIKNLVLFGKVEWRFYDSQSADKCSEMIGQKNISPYMFMYGLILSRRKLRGNAERKRKKRDQL